MVIYITFAMLIGIFIACVLLTIFDIPFIKDKVTISDMWSAFSGISIPLTVLLYLFNQEYLENKKTQEEKELLFSLILIFIRNLRFNIVHLRLKLDLDSRLLAIVQQINNDRLLKLVEHMYTIDKLAPNDTNDNRKNNIMRINIEEILNLMGNWSGKKYAFYENVELLDINNKINGDDLINEQNDELYLRQSVYINTLNNIDYTKLIKELRLILELD